MLLEIFNVEHGACALLTTSNGKVVMIDAGHNASTDWRPGNMLRSRGIRRVDRLFITNYDEDHVSGYPNLVDQTYVHLISRNWRVSPEIITLLKSDTGMGSGIERLVSDLSKTFTGSPGPSDLDFGDTSFEIFANAYGTRPTGFDDENNLSLVVFVTCGIHRIIFPGDMEKAGWLVLLRDPQFAERLSGVTIFVASHHGRENGYCEEVLSCCRQIEAVIISDRSVEFETQDTLAGYRKYTRGFVYNGNNRHILTTRRDGDIKIDFPAQGQATVYLQNGGT